MRHLEVNRDVGFFAYRHIRNMLGVAARNGMTSQVDDTEPGVSREVLVAVDPKGRSLIIVNDSVNRRAEGGRIIPPKLAIACRTEVNERAALLRTVYDYGTVEFGVTYGSTASEGQATATNDLDRVDAHLAEADAILAAALKAKRQAEVAKVVRLDEWRHPPEQ
jgi:hypothetical protein